MVQGRGGCENGDEDVRMMTGVIARIYRSLQIIVESATPTETITPTVGANSFQQTDPWGNVRQINQQIGERKVIIECNGSRVGMCMEEVEQEREE